MSLFFVQNWTAGCFILEIYFYFTSFPSLLKFSSLFWLNLKINFPKMANDIANDFTKTIETR